MTAKRSDSATLKGTQVPRQSDTQHSFADVSRKLSKALEAALDSIKIDAELQGHVSNMDIGRQMVLDVFDAQVRLLKELVLQNPELKPLLVDGRFVRVFEDAAADIPESLKGKPKWSDKVARAGRNTGQFLRGEYGDALSSKVLTRKLLGRIDFPLLESYKSWIKIHPEDAELIPAAPKRKPTVAESQVRNRKNVARHRQRRIRLSASP